ncbi:MAG: alanine:cation symporter family protein [Anaerotruncus sp.]|nr:alanine:cation symporter family protein [Anaerotruncus sp.]
MKAQKAESSNRRSKLLAVLYFAVTIFIILKNIKLMPEVFSRIFQEAFGFKQIAGIHNCVGSWRCGNRAYDDH